MKIGRGEAKIVEPTELSIKRIYWVQWKQTSINQDELAKLYWEDGLNIAEIAKILGVAKTTVWDNIQKLERQKYKETKYA